MSAKIIWTLDEGIASDATCQSPKSCVGAGHSLLLQTQRSMPKVFARSNKSRIVLDKHAVRPLKEEKSMKQKIKSMKQQLKLMKQRTTKSQAAAYDTLDSNDTVKPKKKTKRKSEVSVAANDDSAFLISNRTSACGLTCHWSCTKPVCEEQCAPRCKPPKCETRCKDLDLSGCDLECTESECHTICLKTNCTGGACPKTNCTTECGDPNCKLNCPMKQDCERVCETPNCHWECNRPDCPAPDCHLECENLPEECNNSIHETLPDLKEGEVKIPTLEPHATSESDQNILAAQVTGEADE